MSLSDDLLKIKSKILDLRRKGKATELNEEETRRILIDPLIRALGYDPDDLDQVRHGWNGGKDTPEQKEADYALFISEQGKPCIIVEAKRLKVNLDKEKHASQTLTYAYLNGVPWCVLTNGSRIDVFEAFGKDRLERLIFSVDIEHMDEENGTTSEETADLMGLLTPDSIKGGRIEEYIQSTGVRKAVFTILREMVDTHDPSLIRFIRKKLNRRYSEKQISNGVSFIRIQELDQGTPIQQPASKKRERKPELGDQKPRRKKGERMTLRKERWQKLDTLVVPAREDGFEEVFLGENRWYAVRIRKDRIPFIKYIAAYRVRPVRAITHYAEVASIEICDEPEYKGQGKYLIKFKRKAVEIKPVHLKAVQAPQFRNLDELLNESRDSR